MASGLQWTRKVVRDLVYDLNLCTLGLFLTSLSPFFFCMGFFFGLFYVAHPSFSPLLPFGPLVFDLSGPPGLPALLVSLVSSVSLVFQSPWLPWSPWPPWSPWHPWSPWPPWPPWSLWPLFCLLSLLSLWSLWSLRSGPVSLLVPLAPLSGLSLSPPLFSPTTTALGSTLDR